VPPKDCVINEKVVSKAHNGRVNEMSVYVYCTGFHTLRLFCSDKVAAITCNAQFYFTRNKSTATKLLKVKHIQRRATGPIWKVQLFVAQTACATKDCTSMQLTRCMSGCVFVQSCMSGRAIKC